MDLGIKLRFSIIKEMPITCFNRVTGLRYNHKWKARNHLFGVKGIYGIIMTIHWDRR